VIQISPQPEIAKVSGREYLHGPGYLSSAKGAEKKGGSGLFGKIFADLLKKTGAKDADSGGALSGIDAEDKLLPSARIGGGLSALMPGAAGKVRLRGKAPENEAEAPPAAADKPAPGKAGKSRAASPRKEEIPPGADYLPVYGKTAPAGEGAAAGDAEKTEAADGADGKDAAAAHAGGQLAVPPEEAGALQSFARLQGDGGAEAAGIPAAPELPVPAEIRGKEAGDRKERFDPGAAGELFAGEGLPEDRTPKTAATAERSGNRLEEARREKRRSGASLEAWDLRNADARAEKAENGAALFKTEAAAHGGAGTADLTVELRSPAPGDAPSRAETGWETRSGRAFEDLLARELHQNLNSDIVRHASVVLRDGGEGTIRLSLKPESLGNVKIRLEMAENKITGHIVVESEEALRAFEREIHSLEQTFRDSGFQGAELEMSLAADYGGADRQWKGEEAGSFLPGRLAASRYEDLERADTAAAGASDVYRRERNSINVLA
jgi:hypothetical protein